MNLFVSVELIHEAEMSIPDQFLNFISVLFIVYSPHFIRSKFVLYLDKDKCNAFIFSR